MIVMYFKHQSRLLLILNYDPSMRKCLINPPFSLPQETPKPQLSPIVRGVLEAPADLHRHRVHEAWQFAQLPAKTRSKPNEQCGTTSGHVHSSLQGNGVSRATQLHPSGSGSEELSGGQ